MGSTFGIVYEVEKKPKLVEWNDKKSAESPFLQFPIVSRSKMPYAKPYRLSNAKPEANLRARNEKSEIE